MKKKFDGEFIDLHSFLLKEKSYYYNSTLSKIDPKDKSRSELSDFILNWYSFGYLNNPAKWKYLINTNNLFININRFDLINADGLIWILFILDNRKKLKKFTAIECSINQTNQKILRKTNFIEKARLLEAEIFDQSQDYSNSLNYILKEKRNPDKGSHSYETKFIDCFHRINGNAFIGHLDQRIGFFLNHRSNLKEYLLSIYGKQVSGSETSDKVDPFVNTISEFLENIVKYSGNEYNDGLGFSCYTPLPENAYLLRLSFTDSGDGIYKRFLRLINDSINNGMLRQKNESLYSKYSEIMRYLKKNRYDKTLTVSLAILFRFYVKENQILGIYPGLGLLRKYRGKLIIRSSGRMLNIDFSNPGDQEKFDNFEKYNRYDLDLYKRDISFDQLPSPEEIFSIFHSTEICDISGTHILLEMTLPKNLI